MSLFVVAAMWTQPLLAFVACHEANQGPLDYERLKSIILQCHVKDIDSLLPLLPADYRSSFTLVYNSFSPEAGDPKNPAINEMHPRTILFGNDGKLILAFTGDPLMPFYDRLQIIQYRDKSASFELNELHFDPSGAVTENDTAPLTEGRAKHYQVPESCAKCHGDDPRPNWDSYNFWPGVYGSIDDRVIMHRTPMETLEAARYGRFKKSMADRGRYAMLKWSPIDETNTACISTPELDYNSSPYRCHTPSNGIRGRPNFRLSMLLLRLNAKRAFRLMKSSPLYARFKYRLAATLLAQATDDSKNCLALPQDDERKRRADAIMEHTAREKIARGDPDHVHKPMPRRYDGDPKDYPFSGGDSTDFQRLLYVADTLKIPFQVFSTSFDRDSASIFDGITTTADLLEEEILMDLSKEIPGMAPFLKIGKVADADGYFTEGSLNQTYADAIDSLGRAPNLDKNAFSKVCSLLRNKLASAEASHDLCQDAATKACEVVPMSTIAALSGIQSAAAPSKSSEWPVPLCASCHSGRKPVAKRIPFQSPGELADLLKSEVGLKEKILDAIDRTDQQKMPPNSMLSDDEKKAIRDFVRAIH